MSKEMIYANQTFLNKVIECTGDIENAFEMAFLNEIDISDDVVIGSKLNVTSISNKAIVSYFNETNRPASGSKYLDADYVNPYEFPLGEFPFSF